MLRSQKRAAHTRRRTTQREKHLFFATPAHQVSLHHAGDRPQRRLPTISRRAQDRPTASAPRRSMILGVARRALGGSRGMAAKALALALVLCALGLSDVAVRASCVPPLSADVPCRRCGSEHGGSTTTALVHDCHDWHDKRLSRRPRALACPPSGRRELYMHINMKHAHETCTCTCSRPRVKSIHMYRRAW